MYNFYRWYPGGKVIFLAPTKPLVAQQIEACYGIILNSFNELLYSIYLTVSAVNYQQSEFSVKWNQRMKSIKFIN